MLPAPQGSVGPAAKKVAHNRPVQRVGAFGKSQQQHKHRQLPDLPALRQQRSQGQRAGHHAQRAQFAPVNLVAQPAHRRVENHVGQGKRAHKTGRDDGVPSVSVRPAPFQKPHYQRGHQKRRARVDDVAEARSHHQQPVRRRAHRLLGRKIGGAELHPPARPGHRPRGWRRPGGLGAVAVRQQPHLLRRAAQEPGQWYDHNQDSDAQNRAGVPPAHRKNQQPHQRGAGAAQPVAHTDHRHRQPPPPREPVVHRGNGRVVVAGAEPHRQKADKDNQKIPVAARVSQQDKAQPGHQAAESQHHARAKTVGAVAHHRPLDAPHHPAQPLGQPHHRPGKTQILLHRNIEHGKAPVEGAVLHPVGNQADQDNPPAVKNLGAAPPHQYTACRASNRM